METLNIEYCAICEDIPAINAVTWLVFGNLEGETLNSSERTFGCPRCGDEIARYGGYLEALTKRESDGFIDGILSSIEEISQDSLYNLRFLMLNFTVPSFAVVLEGKIGDDFAELEINRYVEIIRSNDLSVIVLNAHKLSLMDNIPLLEKMYIQSSFINSPAKLQNRNERDLRRTKRLSALVDDFTPEQKEEVLARFNYKCALTGKEVPIHFDHVIPVAVGHGGTTRANMLPIWQRINSSKNRRNVFEWFEEDGARFDVCPKLFREAIEYLAELNGMSADEYRDYVYECHANPNDIIAKESA